VTDFAVIEHGETPGARRFRQNRLKIALAIAVVEGVAVLAGGIPWWIAILLAIGGVGSYLGLGRASERPIVRSVTWVAAVSQLLVVVIPALVAIALLVAVVAVVIIAAVLLVGLLIDRR
jgi:hypothetical protein